MDSAEDALAYDAMDHAQPNDAFVDRLLELGTAGTMLDLGTGPGHIPLLVCRRLETATVLGIDLSEQMLAIARRRLSASSVSGRVRFKTANVGRLPYGGHHFDTVFSNAILHHLADPRPFLAEANRVLRPGGVLLVRDLFRPPDAATLDHLVETYADGCDAHQQGLFRASLHAALTPDELRSLTEEVLLDDTELVVDTDRHMSLQRRASVS